MQTDKYFNEQYDDTTGTLPKEVSTFYVSNVQILFMSNTLRLCTKNASETEEEMESDSVLCMFEKFTTSSCKYFFKFIVKTASYYCFFHTSLYFYAFDSLSPFSRRILEHARLLRGCFFTSGAHVSVFPPKHP